MEDVNRQQWKFSPFSTWIFKVLKIQLEESSSTNTGGWNKHDEESPEYNWGVKKI